MAKQPEERFSSAGDLARAASAAAAMAQMATAINPVPEQTVTTRQFVATPPTQSPPARRGFGRTQWLLAVAAVGVFAAVVGLVLWLVLGQNRTGQVVAPPSTSQATTASEAQTTQPTSTSQAPVALPGTDAQGFIDYPGARCDAGSSPAALARTT
jgi:hypothetical protein